MLIKIFGTSLFINQTEKLDSFSYLKDSLNKHKLQKI
jgi:hypothetical protein